MNVESLRRGADNLRASASTRAHQWTHDRGGQVEFIHINKTGGSSIEQALGLPFNHYSAQQRIARLGIVEWNRRFSFTFVRNPWDRLVSQYHHRVGRGRLRSGLDFRGWIHATLIEGDEHVIHRPQMFLPQMSWISSTRGELLVDEVYRFETIGEDFGKLCARTGLAGSLPHAKPSHHRHYSTYYDADTKGIVGDIYRDDIEFLKYEFERV